MFGDSAIPSYPARYTVQSNDNVFSPADYKGDGSYGQAFDQAMGFATSASAPLAYSPIGKLTGFDQAYSNKQALLNSYMQNAYNSAEAQKNRDWEEYMSSSAYQRAAKDLQAIGFSPMALLSPSGHGATSPSGSSASGSQAYSHGSNGGNALGSIIRVLGSLILGSGKSPILKVIAGDDKSRDSGSFKFSDDGRSWDDLLKELGDVK